MTPQSSSNTPNKRPRRSAAKSIGAAKPQKATERRGPHKSLALSEPPPIDFAASQTIIAREDETPLVAVVMGSKSDWETMQHAHQILLRFGVPHVCRVVSAHRTPALLAEFAENAEESGLEVIIAGAGGAAHLPGMVAAQTAIPVLGVPVESRVLKGQDSLFSIVQMPAGIPVGTLAIGNAGAINAALLAVAILSNCRPDLRDQLHAYRDEQTLRVLEQQLPRQELL